MCEATGIEESTPVTTDDAELLEELRELLNKHSREQKSNTPDFVLASVMMNELIRFEIATNTRDRWYGCGHKIGGGI